jgi:hypothetical protein
MTIYIPKPIVAVGAAVGLFLTYYVIRHEVPAMYRYIAKFEAM